jgi:hypothetical protein
MKRTGMISGMQAELTNLRKQYEIADKNIPALQRNYDTSIIAWQNNNGDLFVVLDAWEALNGSNRKVRQVAGYIEHSSSDRKTTRNEIIMNKYIKYSFVAVVILVVGFGVYYGMNNYNTQPAVEKANLFDAS